MRDGDQCGMAGVLTCSFGAAAGVRFNGAGLELLYVDASRDGVSVLAVIGVLTGFKGELTPGEG